MFASKELVNSKNRLPQFSSSPLDTWALGTYRRFDALNVPAFYPPLEGAIEVPEYYTREASLFCLTTNLPQKKKGIDEHFFSSSNANSLETLSLYFRYLCAPQTFEPLNSYKVHRPVPSVRCLFPYQIMLAVQNDTTDIYRYHPDYHAFESVDSNGSDRVINLSHVLNNGEIAVFGIGQYWKLAEKYGEFTPFVVNLEMGGLKAQSELLTSIVNWTLCEQDISESLHDEIDNLLLPFETLSFATVIKPSSKLDLPALASVNKVVNDWMPRPGLDIRFSKLKAMDAEFDWHHGRFPQIKDLHTVSTDSDSLCEEIDILSVMRQRNSGNDANGFLPESRNLVKNHLEKLVERFRKIRQSRPEESAQKFVSLQFFWMDRNNGSAGLYNECLEALPLRGGVQGGIQAIQDALPNQVLKFNIAEMTLSVLMVADTHSAIRIFGGSALKQLHIAAGGIAQDFGIAASSMGMFARPVRMFDEATIESRFNLRGQLIYQILTGFNRQSNLKFRLL